MYEQVFYVVFAFNHVSNSSEFGPSSPLIKNQRKSWYSQQNSYFKITSSLTMANSPRIESVALGEISLMTRSFIIPHYHYHRPQHPHPQEIRL
jgi:hypothetical protein